MNFTIPNDVGMFEDDYAPCHMIHIVCDCFGEHSRYFQRLILPHMKPLERICDNIEKAILVQIPVPIKATQL